MVSLLLAVLLSGVTSAPIKTDYAEAYQESLSKDKPLMVVVSAPWCPACNVLKQTTIEPMAQTGELDDVSVAVLNKDSNPELVKQLTKGENMLPQIIMFTRTESGQWTRRRLMGYQPKQPVRNLIRSAVTLGRG
ncbi:thioredoxin family protein [Roseiconus nitratireducens]|uniref:Thioredoxin family protein n=1 Tax=Roseiconus nitratireducens TaxID=2605748 RepID=A0A5M6DHA0_9BACT|nr:thioredoxin family protein [Roseiconus nitratireducens]KAA5546901.1 thioredoxin family protein [Roseiconus nitratireducens]